MVDNDEQLIGMCQDCLDDISRDDKCTRCGKTITSQTVNPNFDRDRFDKLKNEAN